MSNFDYHPNDELRLTKDAGAPPKEKTPPEEVSAQNSDAYWHSSSRHDGTGSVWESIYAEAREKSSKDALSQIDEPPAPLASSRSPC